MTAIDGFKATLDRSRKLFELHSSGPGRPPKDRADMLRAAVVLAVAAVDSYFHDKILERLTPFLKQKKGKNLPGALVDILKERGGVRKLLDVMYRDRPHRHIHTMVKKAQADKTFQKPGKISSAVRVFGLPDFWYRVAREMRGRVSKDYVKKKVGQYARRRDKIAHEGDRKRGGQLKGITRPYVRDCMNFLERVVTAADAVINRATGG